MDYLWIVVRHWDLAVLLLYYTLSFPFPIYFPSRLDNVSWMEAALLAIIKYPNVS